MKNMKETSTKNKRKPVSKTDKNQRDIEALQLWISGKTLLDIAKHYGVPVATVEGWYRRKNWKTLRDEQLTKAREAVLEKFKKQVIEMNSCLLESSKYASKIVETAFKKTYDECMTGATVDFELLEKRIESIRKISDKLRCFIPHHTELLQYTVSQIQTKQSENGEEYKTFDDELEACLEDEED